MKTLMKITLAFISLILVMFLMGYFSIAFYEMNLDVSEWSKAKRACLLAAMAMILSGTPIIWMYLEKHIK